MSRSRSTTTGTLVFPRLWSSRRFWILTFLTHVCVHPILPISKGTCSSSSSSSSGLGVVSAWTTVPVSSMLFTKNSKQELTTTSITTRRIPSPLSSPTSRMTRTVLLCSMMPSTPYNHNNHNNNNKKDDDIVNRLGLDENFDRWRFMQKLLDYEVDSSDVNEILYRVLEGYLKYPRPKFKSQEDDSMLTGSPPLTDQNRPILETLLGGVVGGGGGGTATADDDIDMENDDNHNNSNNCIIEALAEPECSPGNVQVLQQLQQLLPDPQEEEDEHKGTWDTIMELHGRESTKVDETKQTPQWVATCLVARVLVYYDFLTLGIVHKPIDV